MGTVGSASSPSPRQSGRGSRSPAGWIVAGVLAIALAVFVAFETGKRSHVDREIPTVAAAPRAEEASPVASSAPAPMEPERQIPAPLAAAPQDGRIERAVMEVTLPPRPATLEAVSAPTAEPGPAQAETLHEKMARCLFFKVEDDEIHGVSMPTATQLLVTVTNGCDFSFAGTEVWFEARAIPHRGGGTAARETGRFQTPIEARGRAETRIILSCPTCYAATHRLEGSLWWASGGGRTE